MLNQLSPNVSPSLQTDFLDNDRDRLALVCSTGDRYKGLRGDAVASLWASTALVKQQEVKEARLGRLGVKYRNARDEYIRCRAFGTPSMGYRAVARKHGIAPVLLSRFNKREYQEILDSTDADDNSSNEESSTGDF